MARINLGKTLAIANPTSHSGKAAAGAEVVRGLLEVYSAAITGFEMRLTQASGDAERIAAQAEEYDTVIVVGGDGVIHEAVNGLMAVPQDQRPRLAIVPMGSGNDFARTLGMVANNPQRALEQILTGTVHTLDLGHVTSDACPEGTYFTESLSFGLDAAVAIDTTNRRAQGTRQEGSGLFVTSAIKLAARASKGYPCVARINGEGPLDLTSLIFAVLNGPTYGGGFRICPGADPTDGLLDVCYNVRQPRLPRLMLLLGLARFGLHTHSPIVRMRTLRDAQVTFAQDTPCQVDGEKLGGREFCIRVEPRVLQVVVPAKAR